MNRINNAMDLRESIASLNGLYSEGVYYITNDNQVVSQSEVINHAKDYCLAITTTTA